MESINELIKIKDLEKSTNEICEFIQDEISNKLQKKRRSFWFKWRN